MSVAGLILAIFSMNGFSQKAPVTLTLNEQFFDSALDAVFKSGTPLDFSIGAVEGNRSISNAFFGGGPSAFDDCSNAITVQREVDGIQTAVRFREGSIYAPLAFTGQYTLPIVGCVDFSGVADSTVALEFDQQSQRLIGRVSVTNVNMSGTGGVGGSVVARLVQSSIDKKMNPIEIFPLSKLSFDIPVQNTSIKMRAASVQPIIQPGQLTVVINYDFVR